MILGMSRPVKKDILNLNVSEHVEPVKDYEGQAKLSGRKLKRSLKKPLPGGSSSLPVCQFSFLAL